MGYSAEYQRGAVYTCTVVYRVYMYSATPARTGGWCHCLEWTGEDMVQTSGSRPISGQEWQRSANHSLGWRDLVLRTVSSVHWPSHSSSIIQAQQDFTAQPLTRSGDRQGVQTASDSCLTPVTSETVNRKLLQDDDITVLEPLSSLPRPRCRQGKLQMSISCRFVCRDVLWRVIQTIELSV